MTGTKDIELLLAELWWNVSRNGVSVLICFPGIDSRTGISKNNL